MKFEGTPFIGYRYEDIKDSLNEYFIEPQCFNELINTRPTIFEGSRGFGKTTLLQSIEYKNNPDFFGVYYKVNDNITSHFVGEDYDDNFWIKLFSCYFVLTLSYQLTKLVEDLIKEYPIDISGILYLSKRFFKTTTTNIKEFSECVYSQKEAIIDFINNGGNGKSPYICNYAELIKQFPEAIILSYDKFNNKVIYYLVDEFENLNKLEQKCVLGFLKQHDNYHTFKIVTKPWGIKEYETVGGQHIQLIHDYSLEDLTKPNLNSQHSTNCEVNDFYSFAKSICNKRIARYLIKNSIKHDELKHNIEKYCVDISYEEELKILLKDNYIDEIKTLEKKVKDKEKVQILKQMENNLLDYCILKLYMSKDKKANIDDALNFISTKSEKYTDMCENYKLAFLYKYSNNNKKFINGFKDFVNYSGGNIRFLLEFCNELFSRLSFNENYECNKFDIKVQSEAVKSVAKSDLNSIKYSRNITNNIYLKDNAGLKLRTMIITLGKIFDIIHKSDKLSVIEPNHFIISLSENENFTNEEREVIRECIMNGYLVAYVNNKTKSKTKIILDEYMYKLHPLYCAYFGISWRQKNNISFTLEQLKKLFSGNGNYASDVVESFKLKYCKEIDDKNSVTLFDYIKDVEQ